MSNATKTAIRDLPVEGPRPDQGVAFKDLPPEEQVKALQAELELARQQRFAPETLPDFDKKRALHEQLKTLEREHVELLKAAEADDKKMAISKARMAAEEKMCREQGIPYEAELAQYKPYHGDAELKLRLHKKGYEIEAVRKQLGIMQPEARPLRFVS